MRSTTNATPAASAISRNPPIVPVIGETMPPIESLTPSRPVLWSRNAAVNPVTSDLALLNCPAICSSWPRNTPPASPPARISVASFLVSAPNARKSACASAS
jgi:hypothetical protein